MATYVISDIHGEYDLFMELMEKISLNSSDTLYVLGDIVDRGPHPVKMLLTLMEMPNAICLVGNHELMALKCLSFLRKEITETTIGELNEEIMNQLLTWQVNGSRTTIDEFRTLDGDTQEQVLDFIKDFRIYEELDIGEKEYLLIHAGLGNYAPWKDIEDYSLDELVWTRPDYSRQYFEEIYIVSGHTPTQLIEENPKPGFIYRANHHIAIDCGASFPGGRLGVICLETGQEYYTN